MASVNNKEVQCQLDASDETPICCTQNKQVGVFNAKVFLTRALMDEKINILRLPNNILNDVRQRSMYNNSNLSLQPLHKRSASVENNTSYLGNERFSGDKSLTDHCGSALSYTNNEDNCPAQFLLPLPAATLASQLNKNVPQPGFGPIAMSNGTIQLRLREGIRIDMTLDKTVRVLNERCMVAVALSGNGNNSALIHPNGRVLQVQNRVEVVAYDGMMDNNYVRYAKMWHKGVSFTSETCALTYLVDSAGLRTTKDTFTDLSDDHTLEMFYLDSLHGPSLEQFAKEVIDKSFYSCSEFGTEFYSINGFRIIQAADGQLTLTCQKNHDIRIRSSPTNGSTTLTTPHIHCTGSLGLNSHLFVRCNKKRIHFNGSFFIVRNALYSAGFDDSNLLIVCES